jgi:hypothetical protein
MFAHKPSAALLIRVNCDLEHTLSRVARRSSAAVLCREHERVEIIAATRHGQRRELVAQQRQ